MNKQSTTGLCGDSDACGRVTVDRCPMESSRAPRRRPWVSFGRVKTRSAGAHGRRRCVPVFRDHKPGRIGAPNMGKGESSGKMEYHQVVCETSFVTHEGCDHGESPYETTRAWCFSVDLGRLETHVPPLAPPPSWSSLTRTPTRPH